jgi:hypothetical protein
MCHNSVNLRQIRDTRRLKAWLRAGNTVELRECDRVIARIVPENAEEKPRKCLISRPAPGKYWGTAFSRISSLRIEDVIERLCGHQCVHFALRAKTALAASDELLSSGSRLLLTPLHAAKGRAIDMCHNM